MSLAALLMGVANRAGEVQRRDEQRQYHETLAGKAAQSDYLMKQIGDPSLPDEERQAYEDSFEKLHKLPKGIVSFGRQMHPHLDKMVQQQATQLAPSVEQQQMPSAPAAPAPAATEPVAGGGGRLGNVPAMPTNEQQPLQALPRATPTLGMPPSPPPEMQAPDTELGRRHLRANQELASHLGWLDTLPLPEELKSLVKAHAAGLPPTVQAAGIGAQSRENVATQNNLTKIAVAQQNLKQGSGPVYEYMPESGPAIPVRQMKGGGFMDATTGERHQPQPGEVLTHVGDKTKWTPDAEGNLHAISEKTIQTRQERSGTSSATMGFKVPQPAAKTAGGMTPSQQANRSDRSFALMNKDLETIAKPIRDRAERLDRVNISIEQNTPQADSLIAPELLTAMAGGAGSGLRMNEAEISRIIGGRSNWETLKAKVLKWNSDPSKALQVTPAQRNQMRSLVKVMNGKVKRKMDLLDQANQALINTEDVKTQREITQMAKKAIAAVDTEGTPSSDTKVFQGHTYKKGSDGQWHRQGAAQ